MKRIVVLVVMLICAVFIFAQNSKQESNQTIQHEASAINIEVPVRVYKGDEFVDDLTIDDFELYEDGILQTIDAVYLIRNTNIIEQEHRVPVKNEIPKPAQLYIPSTSRNFVIMFEIINYLPKIGLAIDHFFNNVVQPNDSIIIVTPQKTYSFNPEAFQKISKAQIADQLKTKLKKDSYLANREYQNLLRDFKGIQRIPYPPEIQEVKKNMLLEIFRKLKSLMYFDEKKALSFADYLKKQEGQKHVFFFYQKYLLPVPPDLSDWDEFELFHDISYNTDRIREMFSDSTITCHFLYIPDTPADEEGFKQNEFSGKWIDQSAGIFRGFNQISEVTGGISSSSINPEYSFQKAVEASENYYVLYYSPKNYSADGKFKKIKVKVKGNYKVLHRAGYIAD